MTTDPTSRRTLTLAVLILLVGLCYVHGHYQEYVFDDQSLIGRNEAIQSIDYLPGLLGFGPKAGVPSHRMVRNLSYALDFAVWGTDLRGFHLTNVFIHLLATVLVYGLGRRVFGPGPWAFLLALLWGAHPIQTDSVTYLSGRRDVLAGMFYLWAMDRYLAWRVDGAGRTTLVASFVLYVIGCFAKEVAVTLPAVIVLYEVVRARREDKGGAHPFATLWRQARTRFMVAPVYYGLLAVFPLAFTLYILKFHPYNVGEHYLSIHLKLDRLSIATYGLHYLKLMVFPRDLSLDYFPDSLPGSPGIADPTTLCAIAVLSVLTALTVYAIQRGSHAGFGAGWFVITFLPMSNLIIRSNEPVAEHYLYVPSVGFVLAVVAGLRAVAGRRPAWRPAVLVVAAAMALALGWRTDSRNRAWENPELVYKESLAVFPRSSRLLNNLACLYVERNQLDEALVTVKAAIAASYREALYHYNYGFIMRKQERFEEALKAYDIAISQSPHYVDPRVGRAFTLIRLRRFDEAVKAYDELIDHNGQGPRGWYFHHWRGVALREKGAFLESRQAFALALERGSRHPETLWQLSMTCAAEARKAAPDKAPALWAESEKLLNEAIAQEPQSAVLRGVQGDLYREMGANEKALASYTQMALANDEYTADSAVRRAKLYRQMGNKDKARETYAIAKSYQVTDADLESYLGTGDSPRSR